MQCSFRANSLFRRIHHSAARICERILAHCITFVSRCACASVPFPFPFATTPPPPSTRHVQAAKANTYERLMEKVVRYSCVYSIFFPLLFSLPFNFLAAHLTLIRLFAAIRSVADLSFLPMAGSHWLRCYCVECGGCLVYHANLCPPSKSLRNKPNKINFSSVVSMWQMLASALQVQKFAAVICTPHWRSRHSYIKMYLMFIWIVGYPGMQL